MKTMNFKTGATRTVAAGCLVGLMMAAQSAAACTLSNWSAAVGLNETDASLGTIAPGAPNPAAPDEVLSPRYSGRCAMAASGQGYVEDVSPGGIDRIRARFYVLANNSTDAVIYRGFDGNGSGSELFNLQIAADGAVLITSGSISIPAPGAAVEPGWNSVEIDWNSGGAFGLIINGQSVATSGFSATGSLASVRLGNLNGATGTLNFDAYESRRSTEIGRLCVGDADNSGGRGLGDLQAIFAEFQFGMLASGQPDADENGSVGLGDLQTVFEIFQFGTPACPT